MHNLFIRNIRSRDYLELFLVSAVSSLLLVRLFLDLTGYPQLGGDSFHIAHMLWGGLLMMVAIVLMIAFLGSRIMRLSALVGGIGFGVFIDELGKFITKDNDYFYRPTIGILYALFMILYFSFNFLSRPKKLTKHEYQLNALYQFEQAIMHDLDSLEKARLEKLLKKADQKSPITQELMELLHRIKVIETPPQRAYVRFMNNLNDKYQHFWHRKNSSRLIGALFVIEAVVFLFSIFTATFNNIQDVELLFRLSDTYAHTLIVGQLLSSLVAVGFAVIGALELARSRAVGFEFFRRATLVNLLLTDFFVFSRIGLDAMPGFMANLALLIALRYAIYQEQRLHSRRQHEQVTAS